MRSVLDSADKKHDRLERLALTRLKLFLGVSYSRVLEACNKKMDSMHVYTAAKQDLDWVLNLYTPVRI